MDYITLTKPTVPQYLRNSDFYANLADNDEAFVVPSNNFKETDEIKNIQDFIELNNTFNFWCVTEVSNTVLKWIFDNYRESVNTLQKLFKNSALSHIIVDFDKEIKWHVCNGNYRNIHSSFKNICEYKKLPQHIRFAIAVKLNNKYTECLNVKLIEYDHKDMINYIAIVNGNINYVINIKHKKYTLNCTKCICCAIDFNQYDIFMFLINKYFNAIKLLIENYYDNYYDYDPICEDIPNIVLCALAQNDTKYIQMLNDKFNIFELDICKDWKLSKISLECYKILLNAIPRYRINESNWFNAYWMYKFECFYYEFASGTLNKVMRDILINTFNDVCDDKTFENAMMIFQNPIVTKKDIIKMINSKYPDSHLLLRDNLTNKEKILRFITDKYKLLNTKIGNFFAKMYISRNEIDDAIKIYKKCKYIKLDKFLLENENYEGLRHVIDNTNIKLKIKHIEHVFSKEKYDILLHFLNKILNQNSDFILIDKLKGILKCCKSNEQCTNYLVGFVDELENNQSQFAK